MIYNYNNFYIQLKIPQITINYSEEIMLNNKKKWIENIAKNDIITIFWTDTNIDFVNLLFKNEENILTYYLITIN